MKKPATKTNTLAKFSGHLLLVGAGKMGSAMLDGWLARGLAPKRIAIVEPQPARSVKALTRRGLKLNPKGKAGAAAAADRLRFLAAGGALPDGPAPGSSPPVATSLGVRWAAFAQASS